MGAKGVEAKVSIGGGGLLRNNAQRRGPGATYGRTQRAWTTDTFDCIEYGSEAIVPDDDAKNLGRFFDLEARETVWKYREVQLAHELRCKTLLFDTVVFSVTTSATAYTNAALATFDIGLDVDTAKQSIQSRGESIDNLTLVMSLNVFNRARQSTRLQNRIRGTISTDSQLVLDTQAMADAFGVGQVLVGAGAYDTSGEGNVTATMSNIWSDTYLWLGQSRTGKSVDDYFAGGTAQTLFWEQDADIFQVESYREEDIRSTIIRARQYTSEKVINANTAQLVVTQWS